MIYQRCSNRKHPLEIREVIGVDFIKRIVQEPGKVAIGTTKRRNIIYRIGALRAVILPVDRLATPGILPFKAEKLFNAATRCPGYELIEISQRNEAFVDARCLRLETTNRAARVSGPKDN